MKMQCSDTILARTSADLLRNNMYDNAKHRRRCRKISAVRQGHRESAVKRIACQMEIAQERAPGQGLDLSVLNVADTGEFFRKK